VAAAGTGTPTLERTDRVALLGCPIDVVTLDDAVERVDGRIAQRTPYQHMSINAAKLVRMQRERELRTAVESCELITADGQAIVWASRLLGAPLPERVAGIDLMHALLALAGAKGYRVFLLGARPAVVEKAAQRIRADYPGLRLVGAHHGYFGADGEAAVVDEIAAARADILFVALETPVKELFVARHGPRIGVPFVMGVGGSFDILAGERRRAPRWLQRLGLEWSYRLAQDPRRLFRRYLVGNSRFVWLVLRARIGRRSDRLVGAR
jgi:N-acetylglucosaminyldiphosphoundecaprenol N-acetyl-beta-D-mannosaminyltransferase